MLKFTKSVWRALIPDSVRSSELVTDLKTRFLPHNWIYDEEYYQKEVDVAATQSAPGMAASLKEIFSPAKVVDVGCGTGALAVEMMARGVDVYGLEYADPAIEICRARGVKVRKFDIETSGPAPSDLVDADLTVSFEVAEHLPAKIAGKYVSLLTSMAPHVVISAAPPGQGGTDHVNEQPKEYWIEKFRDNGFDLDMEKTRKIRDYFDANGSVSGFYSQNTLAFSKV